MQTICLRSVWSTQNLKPHILDELSQIILKRTYIAHYTTDHMTIMFFKNILLKKRSLTHRDIIDHSFCMMSCVEAVCIKSCKIHTITFRKEFSRLQDKIVSWVYLNRNSESGILPFYSFYKRFPVLLIIIIISIGLATWQTCDDKEAIIKIWGEIVQSRSIHYSAEKYFFQNQMKTIKSYLFQLIFIQEEYFASAYYRRKWINKKTSYVKMWLYFRLLFNTYSP